MTGNQAVSDHIGVIARQIAVRNREVRDLLAGKDRSMVMERIAGLREKFLSMLDESLLLKTPEVRKTGELKGDGYRIEKALMETVPGYYVPLNLYKPSDDTDIRRPAVMIPLGHYLEGKALQENQILCANLALMGYIVLTWDPVCQGERDLFPDYPDERWKKDIWVCEQHMRIGNQCCWLGYNSINYFLSDAVCALNYLCSREDVDVGRIGAAGQSGGGTLTYLLAALDERIAAAAPIHCLSTLDRICRNGIGDSEQSIIGMVGMGFDLADFLWMVAPRPLCINAGRKDFFAIEGVREIYQELKEVYTVLGRENAVELCEMNVGHVIDREVRESVYAFFGRIFPAGDGEKVGERERDAPVFSEEELSCGYGKSNSLTPLDLNRIKMAEYDQASAASSPAIRDRLAGCCGLQEDPYEILEKKSRMTAEGRIDLIVMAGSDGCGFTVEETMRGKARRIVHVDLEEVLDTEILAARETEADITVLRPFGSAKGSWKKRFAYDHETRLAYQGLVAGRSIFEIRLAQLLYYIRNYIQNNTQNRLVLSGDCRVELAGRNQGALLVLFAGVLEDRVARLCCEGLPASFRSYIGQKNYLVNETDILPRLLKKGIDIPALLGVLSGKAECSRWIDINKFPMDSK